MNSYPPKLIFTQSCRIITLLTFLFCLALGLDFLLPATKSTERVESFRMEMKPSGNRYKRSVKYNHTMRVKTENHSFPTHINHRKNLTHRPIIELEHSPIFGFVYKAYIPSSRITVNPIENFRNNSWATYFIALTALAGLFFHKNTEQSINFGIVCFILMLIEFYLLRWF